MKSGIALLAACAIVSANAEVFQFDLGPNAPGGFGLNGANEVPATATSATGRELADYDESGHFIQYDNVTKQLELHFGWGDHPQVGGVDLQGTFSGLHLHGPAAAGTENDIIYNLQTEGFADDELNPAETEYFFDLRTPGSDPAFSSAGYDGTIQLVDKGAYTVAQQEADLLANLWYINVHSSAFPDGEIRGQLIAVPEPHHYALIAGLGLLGFAGYRRFRAA